LSAVTRSAGLGARRTVIAMALFVMAAIAVGPAASVATAESLVNNSPPRVQGHGKVGEELVCGAGSWTGTSVSFEFEWLSNGVPVATGNPYRVTIEDKGSSITCIVIAKTGGTTPETAEEESFNSVTIEGARGIGPKNEELPKVTPTSPTVGQTLTCQPGAWSGSPEIKYSYQWLRDGSKIEPAQTEQTYVVKTADEGHQLSCTVTARNSFGEASATSRPVAVAAKEKPKELKPPEVHGTAAVGKELTCEPGEWAGEPTFKYHWFREAAEISGAEAQTYLITTADQTHHISCRVIARNAAGETTSAFSNSVEVPGSPPEDKTPPTISGTAAVGKILTCQHGEWGGVPTPKEFEYVWVRDKGFGASHGELGVGAGEHYEVKPADEGQTLTCEVTAKNGVGSSVTAASESVIVASGNSGVPTEEAPPEVTGTPAVGQMLTCKPGKWRNNPEFVYSWLREPGESPIASGEKYTVSSTDAGHSLVCKVTAKNSEGSASARSNSVTISANAPELKSPESGPKVTGRPAVNETLTCSSGEWVGTPAPEFSYRWLRDEVPIASAEVNSYVVRPEDRGHALTCQVTAKNLAGFSVAESKALKIPGSQPENAEGKPPTIVGTPDVGEELKCEPGEWTGTPTPELSYQWLLNGSPIRGATTRKLEVIVADEGRAISCKVIAKNSAGTESAISKSVRVPGVKPQNVEAPQVTGLPGQGGTLKCEPGEWIGKPSPSFEYEWLRDNSSITGKSTSESYTVTQADVGHLLSCKVIATSEEGSAEATSAGVEIFGGQSTTTTSTTPSTPTTGGDPQEPVASAAAILAKLTSQLTPMTHGAHIASLLKHGYYSFSFTSISAGKLEVAWYDVPKGAHVSSTKSKPKPILVATVTVSFTSASKKTVKLRLTSVGRSLLKAHRSIKLTAKGVFTPSGGRPVTWLKTFVLNH
jgi:hypothetical protein